MDHKTTQKRKVWFNKVWHELSGISEQIYYNSRYLSYIGIAFTFQCLLLADETAAGISRSEDLGRNHHDPHIAYDEQSWIRDGIL